MEGLEGFNFKELLENYSLEELITAQDALTTLVKLSLTEQKDLLRGIQQELDRRREEA